MPELPDIETYLDALKRLLGGQVLRKSILKSPFLLRTFSPDISSLDGQSLVDFSRIGKRVVWHFESGVNWVFHLMIAGRFHFRKPGRLPTGKNDLLALQFDHGTMMVTEASKKKRASLHVVAADADLSVFSRGGLEVLESTETEFTERMLSENRTLKRALTDPRILSGIGNAYSDEILWEARLSPMKRTSQLDPGEWKTLYSAIWSTLVEWTERLKQENAERFPERVTAFRKDMKAHGKFGVPCPRCETPIQRIAYAENECNYCSRCQTGGKLLADRRLSRLLKGEWPKTIDELENNEL